MKPESDDTNWKPKNKNKCKFHPCTIRQPYLWLGLYGTTRVIYIDFNWKIQKKGKNVIVYIIKVR
jgi:hypothetical protein